MKELTISASIENLDAVLVFITAALTERKCSSKLKNQITVAVEEIFVNIANYAYESEVGNAIIRVTAENEVNIVFEDMGTPYNPLEKKDPNTSADIEEREIGGLGIFMVKNIMDSVEYCRESNKNILVIRKAIE